MKTTTEDIKRIKNELGKELPVDAIEENSSSFEKCFDLIKQLEQVDNMSLKILTDSLIGTVVSKFKGHSNSELASRAKALVKKWKKIATASASAPATTTTPASSTATTPASSGNAVLKKKNKIKKRKSSGAAAAAAAAATAAAEAEAQSKLEESDEYLSLNPPVRRSIAKKFYSFLGNWKKNLGEINDNAFSELLLSRCFEVEHALYSKFPGKIKEYTDKARSLCFNLKKNGPLAESILLGQTSGKALCGMTPEQLASAETQQKRNSLAQKINDAKRLDWDTANEDKINEMCGIKGDLLSASLFTCGRCKSVKTTSTQKQTRSADEPMTVFVLCLNCGNRWKC